GGPRAEVAGGNRAHRRIGERRPLAARLVPPALLRRHLQEERRPERRMARHRSQYLADAAAQRPPRPRRDRAGQLARRHRARQIRVVAEVDPAHAAFFRAARAAATISCISRTRASHPSLRTSAARTSLAPRPAAMAEAISRTT